MIIAEGLEWLHIYWIKGAAPRGIRFKNDVTDPPCSGWQHAFVLKGEKRSTIFCPYAMTSYSVTNEGSEVATAKEPDRWAAEAMQDFLERKWAECQGRGEQKDYDACALVMRRLGWPVPNQIMVGGGIDDRKKGGKEASAELLKPVKVSSKRGEFLKWFMEADGGMRSIREAMAEFSMTRSNALSYLHVIHKDHGIGYELIGDNATIAMPAGCSDPFSEQTVTAPVPSADTDDDSWLD